MKVIVRFSTLSFVSPCEYNFISSNTIVSFFPALTTIDMKSTLNLTKPDLENLSPDYVLPPKKKKIISIFG